MKPGERRRFKMLVPLLNTIADVELHAVKMETTKLLDGERKLLRISNQTRIGGGTAIESVSWTDAQGKTLKLHLPAMNQITYVTTKEIALSKTEGAAFDFGTYSVIKLERPVADLGTQKQIRYRLTLPKEKPAQLFPTTATQSVKHIDDDTAEVVIRVDSALDKKAARGQPTEADRLPNAIVQSDDEQVLAMARKISPGEKEHQRLAVALEKHVYRAIQKKDFSKVFATAADVAENPQGDCTEHAVLLTALARARGLPARVAVGLVYSPALEGFGYHMWSEVWIKDRWLSLDATLGEGRVGNSHIKLADSDLKGGGPYSAFLPVFRLLGRLKIEVIEVKE